MRTRLLTGLAALLSIVMGGQAIGADLSSPVGLWQSTDPDTKQPTGWFFISNHDGVYDGTLVKMFLDPGQDPNVACDKCKDDRRGQRWLGLQIIRGMKPADDDKNKYVDGTILDPRDGDVYSANMTLSPDGKTLIIRGYLGISLLGRNEYWTRLPDSDYGMLDPSIKSTIDPSQLNASAPATTPNPHANSTHH